MTKPEVSKGLWNEIIPGDKTVPDTSWDFSRMIDETLVEPIKALRDEARKRKLELLISTEPDGTFVFRVHRTIKR